MATGIDWKTPVFLTKAGAVDINGEVLSSPSELITEVISTDLLAAVELQLKVVFESDSATGTFTLQFPRDVQGSPQDSVFDSVTEIQLGTNDIIGGETYLFAFTMRADQWNKFYVNTINSSGLNATLTYKKAESDIPAA